MKKLFVFLSLVLFATTISFAGVDKYYIDDNAVESLFETSVTLDAPTPENFLGNDVANVTSDKNPWIAWVLTGTAGVFVCGVHRLYLGSSIGVFIGYLCTYGGFGIIQGVDSIILLIGAINDDISEYIDNTRFIMWL